MVKRPTAVQRNPENQSVHQELQRTRPQWLMKSAVDAVQPGEEEHSDFAQRMLSGAPSSPGPRVGRAGKILRPVLPVSLIDEIEKGYQTSRRRFIATVDARPKLYKQIAVAAFASMAMGGIAGLAVYEHAHDRALTKTALHWVGARILPASTPHRKQVATTRLAVANMTATPNQLMPLPIALETTNDHPLSLRLTGLPEAAYLTAGRQVDDKAWLVNSADLQRTRLAFRGEPASSFSLSVAAVESTTGMLAAPIQEMQIDVSLAQQARATIGNVQAASVVPLSAASAKADFNLGPDKQTEAGELLARADAMLQAGHIEDARRLYGKANSLSASNALLGLAKTYDPDILARLNIKDAKPDTEVALAYYRQAEAAGAAGAREAIEALQQRAAK